MPVPKGYQDRYSIIVASQTARLKEKGKSGSEANVIAKNLADQAISHLQRESKKRRR